MSKPLPAISDAAMEQVIDLLVELVASHDELHQVVARKLEAIRRVDVETMQSCHAREAFLDGKIRQAEGRRQGLVRRMGVGSLRLRGLAEAVGEPNRGRLLVLGEQIRQRAEQIGQLNEVAAAVTEAMLQQYRRIYQALRPNEGAGITYTRRGHAGGNGSPRLLDAVG